jgi:hypothetical protein
MASARFEPATLGSKGQHATSRPPNRSVLPYPEPETGLVEDTLVWLSEQFTWSNLGLGLVAKLCFGEHSGTAKGFRAASVCYSCVAGCPFMYC